LIVTAAHCVEAGDLSSGLGIHVGMGREGGRLDVSAFAARAVAAPDYGPRPGTWNDVGYLTTREPLPIPPDQFVVPALDQAEVDAMLYPGSPVRLVGFGVRDDGGTGVKYEVDTKLTELRDKEVSIDGEGRDACVHDSGGPAMARSPSGWRTVI
jgi:secreted trypsin-like serine protease